MSCCLERWRWLIAAGTVIAAALVLAVSESFGLGLALWHGSNVTLAPVWQRLAAGAVMPL